MAVIPLSARIKKDKTLTAFLGEHPDEDAFTKADVILAGTLTSYEYAALFEGLAFYVAAAETAVAKQVKQEMKDKMAKVNAAAKAAKATLKRVRSSCEFDS
jgi:hypothetical protein